MPFQLLQYIEILIIKTDSKRDIVIKYAGKFRSGPKYIKKIIYNKGRISDQARKLGLLIKNLGISHLGKNTIYTNINSIWTRQFNVIVLTKTYVNIFIKLDEKFLSKNGTKTKFCDKI